MKRNYLFSVLCISLFLFLISSQALAFYPYGTIPQGLGGAYSALGDDIAAIYYNPASLKPPLLFEGGIFTGLYADQVSFDALTRLGGMFTGFDAEDFDPEFLDEIVEPQRLRVYGLGGVQFNIPTLSLSPALAFISEHALDFDSGVLNYTARDSLVLNARYTVLSPPLDLMSFTVGGNVKVLSGAIQRFSVVEDLEEIVDSGLAVQQEDLDSGSGFGLDVGLLVKATDLLTVGISVRDLVHSFTWDEGDVEEVSMTLRGGAAVTVPLLAITFTGDVENFSHQDERLNRIHMGVEKGMLLNTLIFRGGAYSQPQLDTDEMVYSAGLGLNLRAVKANLSLLSQGLVDFKGVSFSGGVRF